MSINANESTLSSVMVAKSTEDFAALNCHHIGRILEFDPATQWCRAEICYKKTFYRTNEQGIQEKYFKNYAPVNGPAIILSGGDANLTFPISPGDECLVIFNDRDMTNWLVSGQIKENQTPRTHFFSDAIILVGLKSAVKQLANYDNTHALLSWGNAKLGITDSKVLVSNTTDTLNSLLQELITEVKNLAAQCAAIQVTGVTPNLPTYVSGPPQNASDISAISGELEATASKIAALLE